MEKTTSGTSSLLQTTNDRPQVTHDTAVSTGSIASGMSLGSRLDDRKMDVNNNRANHNTEHGGVTKQAGGTTGKASADDESTSANKTNRIESSERRETESWDDGQHFRLLMRQPSERDVVVARASHERRRHLVQQQQAHHGRYAPRLYPALPGTLSSDDEDIVVVRGGNRPRQHSNTNEDDNDSWAHLTVARPEVLVFGRHPVSPKAKPTTGGGDGPASERVWEPRDFKEQSPTTTPFLEKQQDSPTSVIPPTKQHNSSFMGGEDRFVSPTIYMNRGCETANTKKRQEQEQHDTISDEGYLGSTSSQEGLCYGCTKSGLSFDHDTSQTVSFRSIQEGLEGKAKSYVATGSGNASLKDPPNAKLIPPVLDPYPRSSGTAPSESQHENDEPRKSRERVKLAPVRPIPPHSPKRSARRQSSRDVAKGSAFETDGPSRSAPSSSRLAAQLSARRAAREQQFKPGPSIEGGNLAPAFIPCSQGPALAGGIAAPDRKASNHEGDLRKSSARRVAQESEKLRTSSAASAKRVAQENENFYREQKTGAPYELALADSQHSTTNTRDLARSSFKAPPDSSKQGSATASDAKKPSSARLAAASRPSVPARNARAHMNLLDRVLRESRKLGLTSHVAEGESGPRPTLASAGANDLSLPQLSSMSGAAVNPSLRASSSGEIQMGSLRESRKASSGMETSMDFTPTLAPPVDLVTTPGAASVDPSGRSADQTKVEREYSRPRLAPAVSQVSYSSEVDLPSIARHNSVSTTNPTLDAIQQQNPDVENQQNAEVQNQREPEIIEAHAGIRVGAVSVTGIRGRPNGFDDSASTSESNHDGGDIYIDTEHGDANDMPLPAFVEEVFAGVIPDDDEHFIDPKTLRRLRWMQFAVVNFSLIGICSVIYALVRGLGGAIADRNFPPVEGWISLSSQIFGPNLEQALVGFGSSVAVSSNGEFIVTTAPGTDGENTELNVGAVHILTEVQTSNGTEWQVQQTFPGIGPTQDTPVTALSISSSAEHIAVGYPLRGGGNVQLLTLTSLGWEQTLFTNPVSENVGFGYSVSLSSKGDLLAVGAPLAALEEDLGFVRVYQRNQTGSWETLQPDIMGIITGDLFGWSVEISPGLPTQTEESEGAIPGIRIAVGAPAFDTDRGMVRVFERVTASWEQMGADLLGTDSLQRFGESISLAKEAHVLAVGARGSAFDPGRVQVFRNIGQDGWVADAQVFEGVTPGEGLGASVDLSNDGKVLAIGSPDAATFGDSSGHIQIYRYTESISSVANDDLQQAPNIWIQQGSLIGAAGLDGIGFGTSVALSANGQRVVVGAPTADFDGSITDTGSLFVFDRLDDSEFIGG